MSRESIRNVFENTRAEAVLVTDPFNMRYLSGFSGGEGILYISPKRKVLITDSRYTEAAAQESDYEIIEESYRHKRTQILNELLEEEKAAVLGYEDQSMRCCEFNILTHALKGVKEWLPLKSGLADLRQIKTAEELEKIRMAESIGDKAFDEILKVIKPGMTELEVAAELEYQLKRHGGQKLSFDTIIASGTNSSMPHAVPTTKKLEMGDFITMDFGCIYDGYCSDMTRTIVLGKADEKQKEIYSVVLEAQERALAGIHAGMIGKECDALARAVIEKAGYGKCFGHSLGHGLGLFIHEDPRFSPTEKAVIEENMVLSVEPGIYIPGFGGVRIEDVVIVKADGVENIAHAPKQLIEL